MPTAEFSLLGERIMQEIRRKGYSSVYQFWIHIAGEEFSRTSLNKLVNGRSDPKFSTLLKLCRLLDISMSDLLRDIDTEGTLNGED